MTGDSSRFWFVAERLVSIHARRVTGDFRRAAPQVLVLVSIHARRVTGDLRGRKYKRYFRKVSIHARRVTGDVMGLCLTRCICEFQFTPVV